MKKYLKEIIILLVQLGIFYVMPLFGLEKDAIGLIILITIVTFVLSIIMGIISNNKIKYFYPLITVILFLPTIFIYYNESALIHAVIFLIETCIGISIGSLINKFIIRNKI